ncbi:MAG TPA: SRPBCC family protein [Verrucomicrobiota bacterium]|nr:SRPBCC family protein [Verrucomicrobiota bacterium]
MKIHVFETELWLPQTVEEVFDFFADARNLRAITPDWLHFEIVTPQPIVMCAGTLIDYRLRVRGIPLRWRTEITCWEPPLRFVDEQLRGPYRQWIHEHRFEPKDGGTLCTDLVRYAVAGGEIVHRLFVKNDVQRIFEFRAGKLRQMFGGRSE